MATELSPTSPCSTNSTRSTRDWFCLLCTGLAIWFGICLTGCRQSRQAQAAPPPPVVSVSRPVIHSVQSYYEYNGNLDSVETVEVTARVQGILTEVAFREGDDVEPNELLFRIDQREYVANVKRTEADKLKASVEVKRTKSEEARASKFRLSGAISEEDFEQRVASRETAEAILMQSEAAVEMAQIQLGYTEIRAPIAGQISRTLVTRGNLVGPDENSLLTNIVSMDPLYIYFDVPERDLIEYQRTMRAEQATDLLTGSIPVEIGVATEVGYPHVGKIDFRENRVDVGTGTVRVRGRIPNPRVGPGKARVLYPGLYARVRIPAGEPQPLPAIPEDAVMSGQEGHFVYVLSSENVVQKRTVKVGPTVSKAQTESDKASGWKAVTTSAVRAEPGGQASETMQVLSVVGIESGLTVDDLVVINGLTKARPGIKVVPQTWELKPPPRKAAQTN